MPSWHRRWQALSRGATPTYLYAAGFLESLFGFLESFFGFLESFFWLFGIILLGVAMRTVLAACADMGMCMGMGHVHGHEHAHVHEHGHGLCA